MRVSAKAAVVRTGVILLVGATQAGSVGQLALAAPAASSEPPSTAEATTTALAPSTVAGGGVTLRSVSTDFPGSDAIFTGGRAADAINNDCLICHSAGMVLNQPNFSRAGWQTIVDQMRHDFKAPMPAANVPAIVDYLVNLKNVTSATTSRAPDTRHGAAIVAQGVNGAPGCAQCHAFNGVSDGSGAFPRVAGQWGFYLASQLRDFASGVRASAVMTPIAKALSPNDIEDVTAYYAGIDAPFLPLKPGDPTLIKRGEALAKAGGPDAMHCDNCHGPGGIGASPAVPYLGGQYAHYIAFTLQTWQLGFRKNSPDAMAVIAKGLDPADVAAVAAYYQQVPEHH